MTEPGQSLALFKAAQIYFSPQFAELPWQAEQVSTTNTALSEKRC